MPANHWQRYDLFLTNANKRGTILLLGAVLYPTYTFCYYEFPIPHLGLRNDKGTNVFIFHMRNIHLSYQRNDKLLLVIEFDDLQVFYLLSVNDKPDERAHLMESRLASCPWVNVQEVEHGVIHHLEKM